MSESAPTGNASAKQTAGAAPAAAVAAAPPLAEWLVGSWSFETSCATDFIAHFDADGRVNNGGEVGRWKIDGDRVTETIAERLDSGSEAPVAVSPPLVRSYSVTRSDAGNGVITIDGRKVPMHRC
ncbi:hypothetical protein AB2M62_16530 [Sphingomonas sp. MMS12-HWE2-04]|uniref:hypothetical protein n=1 Tax=Sphingomonas sp. MMS12-HWE2-04 TaxID=3234199 RepID=UPI00384FC281